MRKRDLKIEVKKITNFIQELLQPTGLKKLIIGLSGGIDSALSATLAVEAVGKENVIAVMLPYKNSSDDSYNDALTVAEWLGIQHYKVDITPMVDAYLATEQEDVTSLRKGNVMARMRMIVLYDFSAKYGGLVVGTGNISEVFTGYFTQYGDNACAFEPIGHLYKTEVWEMSRILGIPAVVIDKRPTADLWSDQTDEQEMGISYERLDEVLYQMFELKLSQAEMLANKITAEEIELVEKLYKKSAFKRAMPPMLEEID